MPNIKQSVTTDGAVIVDGDPVRRALTQLVVDGHMIEILQNSGKYYLTSKGRSFILRGGYAQQLRDETIMRKLADEKLKIDLLNAKRIKRTYWITFTLSILGFVIATTLAVLKLKE